MTLKKTTDLSVQDQRENDSDIDTDIYPSFRGADNTNVFLDLSKEKKVIWRTCTRWQLSLQNVTAWSVL